MPRNHIKAEMPETPTKVSGGDGGEGDAVCDPVLGEEHSDSENEGGDKNEGNEDEDNDESGDDDESGDEGDEEDDDDDDDDDDDEDDEEVTKDDKKAKGKNSPAKEQQDDDDDDDEDHFIDALSSKPEEDLEEKSPSESHTQGSQSGSKTPMSAHNSSREASPGIPSPGKSDPPAPSQSQPFPLPAPDPLLMPTLDVSRRADLPDLESSPEPDFPSLADLLERTRPQKQHSNGSQKVNSSSSQKPVSRIEAPSKSPAPKKQSPSQPTSSLLLPAHRSKPTSKSVKSSQPQTPAQKKGGSQPPRANSLAVNPIALPLQPASQTQQSRPKPRPRPIVTAMNVERTPHSDGTNRGNTAQMSSPPSPSPDAVGAVSDTRQGKRKPDDISDSEDIKPSEPTHPAKRPRTNKVVSPSRQPKKHETFWILDGNAVLEIGGIMFKLHRSRLVDQSQFFADLFEAGLSCDDDVVIEDDGISGPVYHLPRTNPRDFEALLRLDKNPFEFVFATPPFHTVAAILRAATRLRFPKYREYAVQYLEKQWPSDLGLLTPERQPHAVDVIILGRQYDVPRVLKRAFYELLRSSGFGLNEGDDDEEGDGIGDLEMDRLDERRLVRAREHLQLAWIQATKHVDLSFVCPNQPMETDTDAAGACGSSSAAVASCSQAPTPKCPSPQDKSEAWDHWVIGSDLIEEFMWDPLCGLQALMDIRWSKEEQWCKECVKMRRDAWAKTRTSLWARMDVWMSLK